MERRRRRLLAFGGALVLVAMIMHKVATPGSAAAQTSKLPGIHISVVSYAAKPEAVKGHPYAWTMTVYGPDNVLNGMGWGGATDYKTTEDLLNAKLFPSIYSLTGAVNGDVVELHGVMLYSGGPDGKRFPLFFRGNLNTDAVHVEDPYEGLTFDGTGVVSRI